MLETVCHSPSPLPLSSPVFLLVLSGFKVAKVSPVISIPLVPAFKSLTRQVIHQSGPDHSGWSLRISNLGLRGFLQGPQWESSCSPSVSLLPIINKRESLRSKNSFLLPLLSVAQRHRFPLSLERAPSHRDSRALLPGSTSCLQQSLAVSPGARCFAALYLCFIKWITWQGTEIIGPTSKDFYKE